MGAGVGPVPLGIELPVDPVDPPVVDPVDPVLLPPELAPPLLEPPELLLCPSADIVLRAKRAVRTLASAWLNLLAEST